MTIDNRCAAPPIPPEVWSALGEIGYVAQYGSGATILFQGLESESMLLLEAGLTAVSVAQREAAEVFLAFRGPGSLLGEFGYLDHQPRSAMVRAVAPTRCRVLLRPTLDRFLDAHPEAQRALAAAVTAKYRAVMQRRIRYSQGRLGQRIGRVLLDHVAEFGIPEPCGGPGWVIDVPLSQARIADLVGAGPRIVGQELGGLAHLGLIDTGYRSTPRRLRVFDPAALERRLADSVGDVAQMRHQAG